MMDGKPRKMVHNIPTFYGAYEVFKEEAMTYGGRTWNAETVSQYDAIVQTHIVPYLQNHNRKHIGQLFRQDYNDALDRLKKRGKNPPGEPFEPWEKNGVPEKVDYLMRAVVWAASNHSLCRNVFVDRENSRIGGGGGEKTGADQARTMKSLAIRWEILAAKHIMKGIFTLNSSSGLLLMMAEGLRNNEATGVNFGYIREFSEYPGHYYLIVPQTTDLGASTVKILGKTANSGRKVPIPKPVVKVLFKLRDIRAKEAASKGYTEKMDDMPIVCKEGKPWERCSADDLSRAAKDLFVAIGMREDEIIELNQELLEEAQAARDEMEEDEFREIESDPTAYLLRRNFATHIAVLGLRDVEIWYVIGHKIESEYVQRKAFNDEKLLFALKRKMDERPILNEIIMEEAIRLEAGKTMDLKGSKKIVLDIPADQVFKVKLNLTAREPGDEIRMRVTNHLDKGELPCEFDATNVSLANSPGRTIDEIQYYHGRYMRENTDDFVISE